VENVTYYDYMGPIDRNLRSAGFQISDQNKISVSLPIVVPNSETDKKLAEYGTADIGGAKVLNLFPTSAYDDQLKKFMELNELRRSLAADNSDFERFLQELIQKIADQVQLLSKMKLSSSSRMVIRSNELLLQSFKASYNHYSSELESAEIERIRSERFDFQESAESYKPFNLKPSSRMRFDPISMNWVAEDGSRSSFPFGINQIQEEIVAPIIEALLQETRLERLNIYNSIKDQKLDYLNQWHRDTDDFYGRGRLEARTITNLMQTTITELTTAISQYRAFDGAEKGMGMGDGQDDASAGMIKEDPSSVMMSVAYCETQMNQIRNEENEFNDFVLRLKEDIDRRSGVFAHVKYFDASMRDGVAHDIASAVDRIAGMDARRHPLIKVNALMAERAKLPPKPDLEKQVYDEVGFNLKSYAKQALEDIGGNGSVGAAKDAPTTGEKPAEDAGA
jgi:hypothetical protein